MDKYSGWEDYYLSNSAKSIWKEEIEPFLFDNQELLNDNSKALKVLDVACGDGRNTAFFADNKNIVCCLDISKTALIKLGEKHPSVLRINEDFISSNIMPQQFDIVMCFDGLPQMDNPNLALEKMISLTKVNGLIVFNFFTPNDCAYGEGKQIDEFTFSFKDTIFKFYTFEQAKKVIPSDAEVVKSELRNWEDPPHGEFRPYPHHHEASFFILKKI